MCEIGGAACNNKGVCGPGNMGCVCEDRKFVGEYCERENKDFESGAWVAIVGWVNVGATIMVGLWLAV